MLRLLQQAVYANSLQDKMAVQVFYNPTSSASFASLSWDRRRSRSQPSQGLEAFVEACIAHEVSLYVPLPLPSPSQI